MLVIAQSAENLPGLVERRPAIPDKLAKSMHQAGIEELCDIRAFTETTLFLARNESGEKADHVDGILTVGINGLKKLK